MRYLPWLAALILLSGAVPAACSTEDADAQTKLTDGVRATSSSDNAWLSLFADSTQLPKKRYSIGEFCFWGINAPHGVTPRDTPELYALQKQAGALGVRYDVPWYGVQQSKTYDFNWYGIEDNINAYIRDGLTVTCVLGYTPAWANGMRDRSYAPSQPVEGEALDLSSGSASLAHGFVLTGQPDITPFLLTPSPTPTTHHVEEVVTTNFKKGDAPRVSHWPIMANSAQVWVDEGAGYQEWRRVDNLINSPDQAKDFMIDRGGRLHFADLDMFWYHGKTPVNGSRIKVTYDSIDAVYQAGSDYTLNTKTGVVSRHMSQVTGAKKNETFDSAPLSSEWQWMNQPASWNVGVSVPGNLRVSATAGLDTVGHFLHQTLSGGGDFSVSMRVSDAPPLNGPNSQAGIAVYQDAKNWFRYGISNDAGRPLLVRCVNGSVTTYGGNGELGFLDYAPRWITLRKQGDTWTAFTSQNDPANPDGGFQWPYSWDQALGWPLKVGVSIVGGGTVDVDEFHVNLPKIGAASSVVAYYDYLDTKPWTDFVKDFVGHYKDRVKYWELWNEPDQGWCWNAGQDVYAEILRSGAEAVRSADPSAKVVSGGYANGATSNLQTIYNELPDKPFDMVAWHPYVFNTMAPDAFNWANGFTNGTGRSIMEAHGDAAKSVFFGEIATDSGVAGSGGGLNERKQTEYGFRILAWARKLGWVKGIQWWPAKDLAPVGEREDDIFGSHAGLFYSTGQPKPSYWMYKNLATNKGLIMDLVNYDDQSNPQPASRAYNVKKVIIGSKDRSQISSIRVLTSLTATDDSSRPNSVAARFSGSLTVDPIRISVSLGSPALRTEVWTATATSASAFTVSGSVSGAQGTAQTGQLFHSDNGVVHFTIPDRQYQPGDKWQFETFLGDGFREAAVWSADGSSGRGDITVELPSATSARYVAVQFTKAASAASIDIDEVLVQDLGGQTVSNGKLYVVDGYQDEFRSPAPPPEPPTVPDIPPTTPDPPTPDPQPVGSPNIDIQIQGLTANPQPKDLVDLTVLYKNSGSAAAANVLVVAPLPRHTNYVSGSASNGGVYDPVARVVRWAIPLLAQDATGTVTFRVSID
ncbi:MAG: DUF11 domain-containing protein [Armatimonadetes bacterium]|nr:DUF11 domain-containing protein [Armatimonadota bacterium]